MLLTSTVLQLDRKVTSTRDADHEESLAEKLEDLMGRPRKKWKGLLAE